MGGAIISLIFTLPAVWTIDTFGRRKLLLLTLPLMAMCLFWAGSSLQMESMNSRLIMLMVSFYSFLAVYSPGLGPVPFVYSAEAFPLCIRSLGMASAVSVMWALTLALNISWAFMLEKLGGPNMFYWFGTYNLMGWAVTYFLLPETKAKTLEELDVVFSQRNRDHCLYYAQRLYLNTRRLFCRPVPAQLPPHRVEAADNTV